MFDFAQIRWEKKAASVGGLFDFKLMSLVVQVFGPGMTTLSTRSCGLRPKKSAKARNRGKWGSGGAAGAMEI
jgi:hypothetical protein